MRKLTGLDVALIVLGGIQLVLTISLYGVCGKIGTETNIIFDYVTLSNLGTASWLLLVCILAIVAGATGHSCPYISTIIISIFAILFTLGAAIVSTLGLFGIFNFVSSYVSLYSSTLSRVYGNAFGSAFGSSSSTSGVLDLYSLRVGMAVINWLSFVLLIPLSCVACCGTCNRTPNNGTIGQTTVIAAGPPGYMNSPPHNPYSVPMQQYSPAAPAYAAAMPQYSGYPQQTEAGQTPQKY